MSIAPTTRANYLRTCAALQSARPELYGRPTGIDPRTVCLFIPPGLKKFKLDLFERIGRKIGHTVRHDYAALASLPPEVVPIVGCTVELRPIVQQWLREGRTFVYWDRGYCRRVFATWLPRGQDGGYYRWHVNAFQMRRVRDVPDDRWRAMAQPVKPWAVNPGGHIVLAAGSPNYEQFHGVQNWIERTIDTLRRHTGREIRVSDKESKIPLADRIKGAHALVTHGSNAAVEAAIMGCPVFVDPSSAAALVGQTDLALIERPCYPEREAWVRSLAYCQFNEDELVDGTLWRLIE